ncbi:MAG: malate synthase G [Nitriliruptoraceae bacterium]|nr:malate synthase G [Nitriliruptoraceae bacterium]
MRAADTPNDPEDLIVDPAFRTFIEREALAGTGVAPAAFWTGLAALVERFSPANQRLLDERRRLQDEIDAWHRARRGTPHDHAAHRDLLERIGYLADAPAEVEVTTVVADPEIARICAPQLVVPLDNPRYAINAANARWGSLYDALYGTDALGQAPPPGAYDETHGAAVIARGRDELDRLFPLERGSHHPARGYPGEDGAVSVVLPDGRVGLVEPESFGGSVGPLTDPTEIWFVHHGLHVVVQRDPAHPIGTQDAAGISDIELEAAATVIMDAEDSVAAVDPHDKIGVYRNWLGLVRGDLQTEVTKAGRSFTRRMHGPRRIRSAAGTPRELRGTSLLLVRNVGLLMTTSAVRTADGAEVPEGIVDAAVTALASRIDAGRPVEQRNARDASVYIVKPKLHGPDEVAFTVELFAAVERMLDLPPNTLKLGLMDEERRTTLNLESCIAACAERLFFINTGFLDRTGDEIHTSMQAGPMVRKADMKATTWLQAYEDRNVDVGLEVGLPGRGQIGKGMWAMPERMQAMLEQKVGHPQSGANCAWVPSPTAATLHALHYHHVDVAARQRALLERPKRPIDDLLQLPLGDPDRWSAQDVTDELENNLQGILGYVTRWVSQGVGCSTVPDIHGVGLMEDRATCRISAQHVANWLEHGIVTAEQVEEALQRMAQVVDGQNAHDPGYLPLAPAFELPALVAARALVFQGAAQPSGYTEPILHAQRARHKAEHDPA